MGVECTVSSALPVCDQSEGDESCIDDCPPGDKHFSDQAIRKGGQVRHAKITYRLAFGPNAGRKALTLQAIPASDSRQQSSELVSKQSGFSLHAGVACKSNQRKKLERLCRYITRPAIAEQRLSLVSNGNVVVALKTPYDDGTSHVVLSPMEGDAQSSWVVWLHWFRNQGLT